MSSRFAIALLLANIFPVQMTYAQQATCPPMSTEQVVSDVVVQGASLNDGYDGGEISCGIGGEIYRRGHGTLRAVQRVSPDGSALVFPLPDDVWPAAVAPAATGLKILASHFSRTEGRVYEIYHFDGDARLLTRRRVHITFAPHNMAVTSSGKTIVIGHHPDDFAQRDDWKYGGAIFDADDQLTRGFDLPLPPGGGGWTYSSLRMAGGDGVAYVILRSETTSAGPQTAIATIADHGNDILKIKVIPVPPELERRHQGLWLFGPGVAVEPFTIPERPHVVFEYDEYDLTTGEKVATKRAPPQGFQLGCYLGNEISELAHSAHMDPARHLPPKTLRFVTSKLKLIERRGR